MFAAGVQCTGYSFQHHLALNSPRLNLSREKSANIMNPEPLTLLEHILESAKVVKFKSQFN